MSHNKVLTDTARYEEERKELERNCNRKTMER
jgi:hypothetical protein